MAVHLAIYTEDEVTPGELEELERLRPKTRGDCVDGAEDRMAARTFCPFVSCKYNTFIRVRKDGSVSTAYEDIEEMPVSNCVLDYSEGAEFTQIAKSFGVTPQAIISSVFETVHKIRGKGRFKMEDFSIPEHRESNLAQAQDYGMGGNVSWKAEGLKSK